MTLGLSPLRGGAQVVALSLRIFVTLIGAFKARLKAEVEVFVSNIFLRILESEHTPHEHKVRAWAAARRRRRARGAEVGRR